MKTLYLLRHAKSDHPSGIDDHDRPLNERGQRDAADMAFYWSQSEFHVDEVFTSSAVRTRQTVAAFHAKNPELESITSYTDSLYNFDGTAYTVFLKNLSDATNCAMLIGHNNSLELVARWLMGQDAKPLVMPTCSLAQFSIDIESWSDIQPGCAELEHFMKPKLLKFRQS